MDYGLRPKKKKKWWLIPVIIAAALVVIVGAVGITVNITNADHETIAASVRENGELRRQIEDLNAEIESLKGQLEQTKSELDARPTPVPDATPAPSEQPERGTSPRNYDG